ncbi:MAG: FAD-dependent oxidoreductase, partial [Desulfobacterales bacterium]|nr:FAD-dependent oxidoreductase [Desulfobacterales bacterium]
VEFQTGIEIGKEVTVAQLRQRGYKAFFMAIAAHECKVLGIEGEDLAGVYAGIDFLREVNLGTSSRIGDRVAVIGGGNVALDAVRTALRTGSTRPLLIYRRSRAEMPASEAEVDECLEENIAFMPLTHPVRILGDAAGRVRAIECVKMALGEPDAGGRRRPEPVAGSEFTLEVDAVIAAIGQESDWACLTEECVCTLSDWGTLNVDPVTLQSEDPDIFAGGDAVSGPKTVVEAIAAGKEAAVSIDRFIQGADLRAGRPAAWGAAEGIETRGYPPVPREKMPCAPPGDRITDFREVQLGLDENRSRREASRCMACGICSECLRCEDVCLAGAIDHGQQALEHELSVGAVILCPGSETFDPSPLAEFYQYGRNPNVMTSLEFERILSASGPTQGHLVRPSDGKAPRKIAWLQCVGSRDINRSGNGYCSAVCCMYAVKEAVVAKEHARGDLDCAIFYMDMRTVGKDYEKYYVRAREKDGVRFVPARLHTIESLGETGDLRLRFMGDSGSLQEEDFNLVVLSVGIQSTPAAAALAQRLGIGLNPNRFAATDPFTPVHTTRPGVFAAGIFQGPKDIPSCVTEASAAACAAGALLADARGTRVKRVTVPEEIDVSGVAPRVGVFVCNCGVNIGGVIDVPALVAYAQKLPAVVYAGQNLFTCSQDTQEQIKTVIREQRLNRVVVAACTPKTHEAIFMDTLEACGLNKYLFEMANIRN